ncbi:hypothetical protein V6N13_033655 [Hibiscus sabdariffa]|uniref:Uncharacterized protein n=1 Tax=Hibiscus sabdariffa TaxID=183260 RepID=A0ABR2F9V5_9ROSI
MKIEASGLELTLADPDVFESVTAAAVAFGLLQPVSVKIPFGGRECRLGYSEEKILASKFHLLEEKSRNTVMLMVSSWNSGVNALKSLCKGKDWILYLKDFHLPL